MTTRTVRKTEKRPRRKRRKVSVKRKVGRIEKIRRKTERRLEMGEAREKVRNVAFGATSLFCRIPKVSLVSAENDS